MEREVAAIVWRGREASSAVPRPTASVGARIAIAVATGVAFVCVGVAVGLSPGTTVLATAAALGGLVAGATTPRQWLVALILPVALVPGSTYGLRETTGTMFSRGSGVLGVPAYEWALILAALVATIRVNRGKVQRGSALIGCSLFTLVILYLSRALTAPLGGVGVRDALSGTGGRLLLVVAAAYLLTRAAVATTHDAVHVIRVLAASGLGVAVFGLYRFFTSNGDPANPYRLYSGINVRLTYFEGAYGVVLACTTIYAYFRYTADSAVGKRRWPLCMIGGVALLALLLTYRRTNWIGLIGAMGIVAMLSRRRKVALALVGVVLALSISALAGGRSLDATLSASHETDRSTELTLAARAVVAHPGGQGPLGHYDGRPSAGWPAPPTIVHNSVLWIGLKLGVLGIALLVCLFVGAGFVSCQSALRAGAEHREVLGVLAALTAFWGVNLVFGTPLLEVRYCTLFGVWLGLVSHFVVRKPRQSVEA